jgi:thioredoxin-like negative regulator of GroEL
MQKAHEEHQANLAKGHGQYLQIDESEFIKTMTGSHHVVCHFYHHDFDRCKIIDMHLARLCKKYTKCKFVSVDAERCPFFAQKLAIQTLPTVVCFEDGVAVDNIMGFEEIGNVRTVPTEAPVCTMLSLACTLTRDPSCCALNLLFDLAG